MMEYMLYFMDAFSNDLDTFNTCKPFSTNFMIHLMPVQCSSAGKELDFFYAIKLKDLSLSSFAVYYSV